MKLLETQSSSSTSKLHLPSINSLALDSLTTGVSELLCHPRYTLLIGNLTRLSIQLERQGPTMNMIWTTAPRLRYLRLDCLVCTGESSFAVHATSLTSISSSVVSPAARLIPAFPSLSYLELILHHLHRNTAGFIGTISEILGSMSTAVPLQELIVTYSHITQYHPPDRPFAITLRALETCFRLRLGKKNAMAWPRVRWRAALLQEDFDEFTNFVRLTMPQMNQLGKLRFERFESTSEGSKE